jgi:hypothetical protein
VFLGDSDGTIHGLDHARVTGDRSTGRTPLRRATSVRATD